MHPPGLESTNFQVTETTEIVLHGVVVTKYCTVELGKSYDVPGTFVAVIILPGVSILHYLSFCVQ